MADPPGIDGIDHALIGVRDLEAARRAYANLGFTLSPRGRHIGWGTANYCIMFPGGYLELLGIVDPAQFCNNLDRFLETREGVLGLAFASADVAGAERALRGRGIEVEAPRDLKRLLELPDGTVELAFRLAHLPAGATPGVAAFVCQHLSRDLVWQAPWLAHANGARSLLSMTGVVEDPGAVAVAYGAMFGEDKVWADRGAVEVETGNGRLRFTTPDALAGLYAGVAGIGAFPVPWLAGLRIGVADLGATAACLDAAGARYLRDGERLLRLDPDAACGVALEFAAA
jgi:catechol 2,3-dioxygenase-like lactoylglutathione lyase family enzyme